ncbi:MAG: NifU family protein [Flavobacteriales bacterium]|nr:NifU family protein [Flavobacteriales bacterium]MCB9449427.1 NifU family protein [Flavobacteriales bacterium]
MQQVITIYAESTPNPGAMKFVANKMLVKGDAVDFKNPEEATKSSPLATRLFTFPFVRGVFIAANFISVTKSESVDWSEVAMELREFIRDYLNTGEPVLTETEVVATEHTSPLNMATDDAVPRTDIEQQIVNILEEYIRPAVEQDGGAISFHSYNQGVVKVLLKGACSGCPSSTITLKAGIEGLMKRMIPEVQAVEAVSA